MRGRIVIFTPLVNPAAKISQHIKMGFSYRRVLDSPCLTVRFCEACFAFLDFLPHTGRLWSWLVAGVRKNKAQAKFLSFYLPAVRFPLGYPSTFVRANMDHQKGDGPAL